MAADDTVIAHMTELAKAAAARAHAPYSGFHVGAVLRGANGKYYTGCNVENAAYPLTLCAEAAAIATMVVDGETRIDEVLVIAQSDRIVTPCGGCRQRIREFATPETPIHCLSDNGARETRTLGEMLPLSFGPEFLR